jgi:protein phosphatase
MLAHLLKWLFLKYRILSKMTLKIPELSLIVLIGTSSSGKSSLAKRLFKPTEILSSDYCRGIVSNDENSLEATSDAFETLYFILAKRLKRGLLTVVDATNIRVEDRRKLLDIARAHHCLCVALVMDIHDKVLVARHEQRVDRDFPKTVIYNQLKTMRAGLRGLRKEGFHNIFTIETEAEANNAEVVLEKLWTNKSDEHGPFDIIGDIHGCYDELIELLQKLSYIVDNQDIENIKIYHSEGRKVLFLGDLVDRGLNSPAVLKLVMAMVEAGTALCVQGNHDAKLLKKLNGRDVQLTHGLAETVAQMALETPEFNLKVKNFLDNLRSHYVLDNKKLVIAHAGIREEMQGRGSAAVRSFCLYGETTGETDEFGLPVRYNWASEYRGKAMVVYGHTPTPEAEWLNNTICLDTGCVFGGKLTAMRYPERQLVSIPAKMVYCVPKKPLIPEKPTFSAQHESDDVIDIEPFLSKQIIETQIHGRIDIRESNSAAALEVMSRFGINPKWVIYLPPTMSPSETSKHPNYLEYPTEAFDYFKKMGIDKVICEEKHMGSRAIVIICKDEAAALKRFGSLEKRVGVVYTRTGRAFFNEQEIENQFITKVQSALTQTDFWTKQDTTWVCLDCELMPWSAKAKALILQQYAAVASAAKHALKVVQPILETASQRGLDIAHLQNMYSQKSDSIDLYTDAFRRYCKDTNGIEGLVLAPFHLMATEGKTHFDKNHIWHLEQIADFCKADPTFLIATPFKIVDLNDTKSIEIATTWWEQMTEKGGEGMVVKPLNFVVRTEKSGLIQPAIKCRGKEYLRIIYGADYNLPYNLERLKQRGLSAKRALALREFALGVEGLDRFVRNEPIRRVYECIFGVMALESEPIDPRL